jgi:Rps23 Pro-64 3,4-dihydroxylase Tpa1-like proline 4-hydroxylase
MVIVDDFLVDQLARDLVEEFPAVDAMPKSRDYVFGDKHELSSIENTNAGARFFAGATSPEFEAFLRDVCGQEVFVDRNFHGGGFHQGSDGSYLDMHVDFNLHPLHPTWLRTLNVLVYLNPDWERAYGGQLLVKRHPDDKPVEVWPRFNRAVIMLTSDETYHGYHRMSLPAGVTRKSIATYAYREIAEGDVEARTTGWVPEGAGPTKRLLARHYNTLVRVKNRLFGSGTAKNR